MKIKKLTKSLFSLGLFLSLLCFSEKQFLYAQIPQSLYGIWEGKDRYVFFETIEKNRENEYVEYEDRIVIILKDYYGWYMDRVVEPEEYSEKYKRDRNIATPRNSVFVMSDASPLWLSESGSNDNSSAYELKLTYDKSNISYVPFALINEKMYLEFWLQNAEYSGFWKGNVLSEGIKVSSQVKKENLWSWYINPDNPDEIYKIRYWKSNMEYDPELEAVIKHKDSDGQNDILIPKHIWSAENVYTCVPGRRLAVRNLDKDPQDFPFDGKNMVFNEDNTIAATEDFYLQKLLDKQTFDELMEIVRFKNSLRKPDPPPLFPPEDLDFHWDLIDYLEKDNVIIQKVRERQKTFGVRGKELGH